MAKKIAEEAKSVSKDTFLITEWMALMYERAKDYAKAAEYYELAGTKADSPMNTYGTDKAYYDDEAARVRGLERAQ